MGEYAEDTLHWGFEDRYDDDDWDDDLDDDEFNKEPIIWRDHTGKSWRLSKMETSHLINILRLIVNRWAESLGVRPVPIRNPVAVLDLDHQPAELAALSGQMALEVLRRLESGDRLSHGYMIVWERVVNKIQECLRRSGNPFNQRLLRGVNKGGIACQN